MEKYIIAAPSACIDKGSSWGCTLMASQMLDLSMALMLLTLGKLPSAMGTEKM